MSADHQSRLEEVSAKVSAAHAELRAAEERREQLEGDLAAQRQQVEVLTQAVQREQANVKDVQNKVRLFRRSIRVLPLSSRLFFVLPLLAC